MGILKFGVWMVNLDFWQELDLPDSKNAFDNDNDDNEAKE